MSQAIRTAFTRVFLFGAFSAAATVACSDSPPADDGAIGTTSQAVTKCHNDDDCGPIRCPVNEVYNGTECVPLKCPPGTEDVGGMCVSDCPAGDIRQGGVCVPSLTPIACPFSVLCPPGQYLTSSAVPVQCSFTPPATCQAGTPPGGDTYVVPPFSAPVATSVALGASAVYAIGIPAVTAGSGDNRAAVFAWGNNEYGQLGDGTFTSSTPTSAPTVPLFVSGNPVVQVVAGDTDACGLLQDGSVYCWGEVVTEPGAISYPTQTQIAFPGVVTYGSGPGSTNNVVALAHGQHHACAQTAGGTVYCWGNNDRGQLGLDPLMHPFVDAGITTSAMGIPLNTATALPVTFPNTGEGPVFFGVISIAAAGDSTCALANVEYPASGGVPADPSTGVYCWGDDEEDSLGDKGTQGNALSYEVSPQFISIPSPIVGGGNLPFSRLVGGSNGSAEQGGSFCAQVLGSAAPGWYCWGGNDFGEIDLAIRQSTTDFSAGVPSPQIVIDPSVRTTTSLAISGDHGCAGAGSAAAPLVYCFGDNDEGQLGFAASPAYSVNVGAQPQLAVTTANGSGTPILAGIPGFSQFAVGYQFTCGLYTTPSSSPASYGTPNALGNIACWGLSQGELPTSPLPALLSW
jgi:alpha-tubulin suppressor-like RCC1 family protein